MADSTFMQTSYNPLLVALSLAVAMLASYTAFFLTTRIRAPRPGSARPLWLLGGALAVGVGTWSMHFIGMLAFSLPIRLGYDLVITAVSLVIAVGVSFFALYTVTRLELSGTRMIFGGILMGLGIAGMHFTGMAAMRMHPDVHYNPGLVALSIALAMVASSVAMHSMYTVREGSRYGVPRQVTAILSMTLAIAGMHYLGMRAAKFAPGTECRAGMGIGSGISGGISTGWVVFTVTMATFSILLLALVLSLIDKHTQERTGQLSESLEDVSRRLKLMSTRDTLTDLANRKSFNDRLELATDAARASGDPFMLLYMDLDGFKTINDSLGHSLGDEVLKSFALRLLKCVRRDDVVARLGGDEFVVLLERLSRIEDAASIAETIVANMQQEVNVGGSPLRVTASIGIAVYPQDGDSAEALLKNADAAMYEAKQAGRNTYRFFEPRMSEAAARILGIQRGLTEALRSQHLSLHFQPLFDGADQRMVGAEALIRWQHPQLGNIPPSDFIPVAERSGQIIQLGNWVIREVCRHIRQWDSLGLPQFRIAINLSPQQLRQPNFVENVIAMLRESAVEPERIIFEVTETVAMQDAVRTTEIVRQFHVLGFQISIDDFGTGYSSLSYLQRFRVKQLKIDRFFTAGLDSHGEEGYAIVAAIIALAHALEMEVVAEGVESLTQLEKLKSLACDRVQGYLLARPMPAAEFERLLHGQPCAVRREAKHLARGVPGSRRLGHAETLVN